MKKISIFIVVFIITILIFTPFNYWGVVLFGLGFALGVILPKSFTKSRKIKYFSPDRQSGDYSFKK